MNDPHRTTEGVVLDDTISAVNKSAAESAIASK